MHILKLYSTLLYSTFPLCAVIQFQPKINVVQCVFPACQWTPVCLLSAKTFFFIPVWIIDVTVRINK